MIPTEIRVHAAAKRNKDPTKEPNRGTISLLPLSSHKRSQTTDEDLHFRIILLTHLHIIGATSSGISILTLLSHHYQQYDHHHHQQSILDSQESNSAGPTTN